MKELTRASIPFATAITLTLGLLGCKEPACEATACEATGGTGGQVGGSGGAGAGGDSSSGGSGGGGPSSTVIQVVDAAGSPVANADVIVNDADGELVLHALTSPEGEVEVIIPEQGSASLVFTRVREDADPPESEHRIETLRFVSAAPAVARFIQKDYPPAEPTAEMLLELSWPANRGPSTTFLDGLAAGTPGQPRRATRLRSEIVAMGSMTLLLSPWEWTDRPWTSRTLWTNRSKNQPRWRTC